MGVEPVAGAHATCTRSTSLPRRPASGHYYFRMVSPPKAASGDDKDDFGLGRVLSDTRGQRLLNPDGTFNVRREGLPWSQAGSVYHDALTVSWPRFLLWTVVVYVGINLLFAVAFLLVGPEALSGAPVEPFGGRFGRAFFFSVQTFATIGYGSIVASGVAANLVVTLEALVGLLAQAVITGLVFARFARPTMSVQFSSVALVAPFNEGRALMIRIANRRRNELIEMDAQMTLSLRTEAVTGAAGSVGRRYLPLTLDRRSVNFFPLSWTLVHPITPASPLWGLSAQALAARDAEVLVLLHGTDETFATRVSSRRSYMSDEIIWGAKFRNIFVTSPADGRVAVDLTALDQHDVAELPPDTVAPAAS